jgi:hypothetical protein
MSSYLGVSSELPSTTSIELFGQKVFTIAHVDVNVNLRRQQVSNNLKKIQIIKTLALK